MIRHQHHFPNVIILDRPHYDEQVHHGLKHIKMGPGSGPPSPAFLCLVYDDVLSIRAEWLRDRNLQQQPRNLHQDIFTGVTRIRHKLSSTVYTSPLMSLFSSTTTYCLFSYHCGGRGTCYVVYILPNHWQILQGPILLGQSLIASNTWDTQL